ncbi:MAG: carboxypeptidase regulatory-like domain-containing protein, partial [Bacteroidia bacterium]|nr:carboxypeptidase regulatory-like domain-containing protein [Bacteroidia bacterium]
MRNYCLVVIFLLILNLTAFQSLEAQVRIYGSVTSDANKPLESSNVLLLNNTDSVLVKGTISGASGAFIFENINPGTYIISASFSGYKTYFSNAINVSKSEINTGVIKLIKEDKELSSVTVVARKPMFEQKIDRMVINVKNSITSAGGTALEVLEKSPGVIVNRQSNSIGLNGKNGVVVMINGKISRMSSDA